MPPVQQTPIQNPLDERHQGKHNKPLFFSALIISLAILVFAIWYGYDMQVQHARDVETARLISQTSLNTTDETTNWKTYKNEEYGFEFKYPSDFIANAPKEKDIFVFTSGLDVIGINFIYRKFDPNNIFNSGGKVDDAKVVNVGGRVGYMYNDGDGPWASKEIDLPFGLMIMQIGFESDYNSDYNQGSENIKTVRLHDNTKLINQILSTFKFVSTSTEVTYEVKHLKDGNGFLNYDNEQLIKKDLSSGKETVLVDDVLKAIPELKVHSQTINELSVNVDSDKIFFYAYRPESDGPRGSVYSFDLNTGKFSKLTTATKYYEGFGDTKLSPNGRYIATISNPDNESDVQRVYLIDLFNDKVKILVNLSGNESITFCSEKGDCWANSNHGNLNWIDHSTLEYAVYDSSKFIDNDPVGDHPIIEKRKVRIQ